MSLNEILKQIQEELRCKDEVRQRIQTDMHTATRLSKQAIFLIHKEKIKEAEKLLKEAGKLFAALNDISKDHPDLLYMGMVDSAFQEYAEAYTFLKLVKEGRFVDFGEINVPKVSYVLGLADVIGELRRRTLDRLRKGDLKTAEDCLEKMETIYLELINLDDIHFLIHGIRRKCDIARGIIEITRGDITLESRRNSLERSIKELKKTLKEREKIGNP